MSPRRVIDVDGHDKHGRIHKPLAGNQLALALGNLPLKASGKKLMTQGSILLVTGNQTWFTREDVEVQFALLVPTLVIHGAADGADSIAELCARAAGIKTQTYPVDTALDGPWPGAGPRRDARMVREGKPSQGLALGALWRHELGGKEKLSGTGQTTNMMFKAGLVVRWVKHPGAQYVDLTEMPKQ